MPAPDILPILRTWGRLPAGQLRERLGVSAQTLMRGVRALDAQVVARGRARRTTYAARRPIRGRWDPFPLYRIDATGAVHEVARLYPTYPEGCALDAAQDLGWPLDDAMADGWFDGLPYPLEDIRPQGFLGRHFARAHALLLQVPDDPRRWSEDDAIHALSLLGKDPPGAFVLGEPALRQWLAEVHDPAPVLDDADVEQQYPALAVQALAGGVAGSSAGGEFPKFTAIRRLDGENRHVIVKFSGSDESAGTRRWADLLVCEHLAAGVVAQELGIPASRSNIHRAGGRTFLEVQRFDRHGARGRSPVCSWQSINSALLGLPAGAWVQGAGALRERGHIDDRTEMQVRQLWHFGRLIANTDMHDGNLSFLPGLQLAPVYDMLPMLYAPERGMELPQHAFQPTLPVPAEREAWRAARHAATVFWERAAADARVSAGFRKLCAGNRESVAGLDA